MRRRVADYAPTAQSAGPPTWKGSIMMSLIKNGRASNPDTNDEREKSEATGEQTRAEEGGSRRRGCFEIRRQIPRRHPIIALHLHPISPPLRLINPARHNGPPRFPIPPIVDSRNRLACFLALTRSIMSSKSRWAADDPETEALVAQRKREKDEKRRAKAEKQRQLEQQQSQPQPPAETNGDADAPPTKRRRLSNGPEDGQELPASADPRAEKQTASQVKSKLLRFPGPGWGPCRHVDNFERLNHIEEGSYGWVSRAKDIVTGEIVALKKLKMENSPDGFPVTGLREIQTLLEARHKNVVYLREIVVGNKMDEYALP